MECVPQLFAGRHWSDAAIVDVPKPELGGVSAHASFMMTSSTICNAVPKSKVGS